jgi:Flp pilus assembly pilin Flp
MASPARQARLEVEMTETVIGAQEVTRVTRIYNFLFSLRREEGQTMAEYGVVLAVITLILVASFTALSTEIDAAIDKVAAVLPG